MEKRWEERCGVEWRLGGWKEWMERVDGMNGMKERKRKEDGFEGGEKDTDWFLFVVAKRGKAQNDRPSRAEG